MLSLLLFFIGDKSWKDKTIEWEQERERVGE